MAGAILYGLTHSVRSSSHRLPAALSAPKKRQERLRKALAAAQKADAKRAKSKGSSKGSVEVAVAYPGAAFMPIKEGGNEPTGGYAPNFNPIAAADGECGMIVDADVPRPLAKKDWAKLPRGAQAKKLDRAAFVHDGKKHCYWCPQGRPLAFVQIKTKGRDAGDASQYQVYTCRWCAGCALAADCLAGHAKYRSVSHDQHEALRRKVALRLRQFLLRGLNKVRTEWLWECTAFNIRKLMSAMEKLRADGSLEPV